MSPRLLPSSTSDHGDEPGFSIFSELPKELRLLIWEYALPDPRIVLLQRQVLRSYEPCENTRVWSDKAIEDVDDQGRPTFFDVPWEDNSNSDDGSEENYIPPSHPPSGFRSQSPPPSLLFVCHESREVVERFYARTFGDRFTFPTTWFDYDIDTLYLGWSWHDVSGVPFSPADLGDAAGKVKHLATYNTAEDLHLRAEGPEERLCRIMQEFHSLETLTLVNRRHQQHEKTSDLVFTDPMNLLIWKPFLSHNSADIDLAVFDEWIAAWVYEEEGRIPRLEDWGTLEHFRKKWAENRLPPWRLPKVTRKIIVTSGVRDRLQAIAGCPGQIEKLSAMSQSWLDAISRDSVSGTTSVDFTPEQQMDYLGAITETSNRFPARSIDEEE